MLTETSCSRRGLGAPPNMGSHAQEKLGCDLHWIDEICRTERLLSTQIRGSVSLGTISVQVQGNLLRYAHSPSAQNSPSPTQTFCASHTNGSVLHFAALLCAVWHFLHHFALLGSRIRNGCWIPEDWLEPDLVFCFKEIGVVTRMRGNVKALN